MLLSRCGWLFPELPQEWLGVSIDTPSPHKSRKNTLEAYLFPISLLPKNVGGTHLIYELKPFLQPGIRLSFFILFFFRLKSTVKN
jgi:hypothetical protein